jgi:hypothetical protein
LAAWQLIAKINRTAYLAAVDLASMFSPAKSLFLIQFHRYGTRLAAVSDHVR